MKKDQTIVIGHKNPDTDSICSAISYAAFKSQLTGKEFVPARAGDINEETRFVLNYFDMPEPQLIESVKTQVEDVEFRELPGADRNMSLKDAWNRMQDENAVTLPIVHDENTLEGLITVTDITKSYMNVYDATILSKAKTSYDNIVKTLEGEYITYPPKGVTCFEEGKVLIAAANPDLMESYIEYGDMVILGNRYESQLCAIEMEAACLIVCEGAKVSLTIRKLAMEHDCVIIVTPYDTFTAARVVNQSIPIGYFMCSTNLVTFYKSDVLDDVKEVMANKRHRDFPILDEDGKYLGMISRRNLLGARGKKVILVDHNEQSQAVAGIESADVREIIDHHRLGGLQTISPVVFRNQPVGCTATIIYQMYQEEGLEIPKQIAGLLMSAILSDTLMFRSPTCTSKDKTAAIALAEIVGVDYEAYAGEMFEAGSNLKNKTDEQILHQDYKIFTSGSKKFAVAQVTVPHQRQVQEIAARMKPYLEKERTDKELDYMYFMVTNLMKKTTLLLCAGSGAEQLVLEAFPQDEEKDSNQRDGEVILEGVVSRKKQLVPRILMVLE
ncbi:MAG: putative manganese-dependent inorganic diphosphatase [Lachnospiraceae bacterium]|nr:putative manganese-dependent inorganic diphosphatase [Lachnospiraceae bacterium]